jgi:hypothetical protein
MVWFDVDGARHYLAQQQGSSVPSRKVIYRMVDHGLKVSRAEGKRAAQRGGTRMYFCPDWIDEFLLARAAQGKGQQEAA